MRGFIRIFPLAGAGSQAEYSLVFRLFNAQGREVSGTVLPPLTIPTAMPRDNQVSSIWGIRIPAEFINNGHTFLPALLPEPGASDQAIRYWPYEPPPAATETKAAAPSWRIEHLHVTQAVQDFDGQVPLVEGRGGCLRIFATADGPGVAHRSLLLWIYDADGQIVLQSIHLADKTREFPLRIDPVDPKAAWDMGIDGKYVKPGYSIHATLLPDQKDPDQTFRYRSLQLNVEPAPPPMYVTLVPIRCDGHRGLVEGPGRSMSSWGAAAAVMLPVPVLYLTSGRAFSTQLGDDRTPERGINRLLLDLWAKRIQDPKDDGCYYGVFPESLFPGTTIAGQWNPTRRTRSLGVGVGYDCEDAKTGADYFAQTFTHELGHALGLEHPVEDKDYPHPDATIGVPGCGLSDAMPSIPATTRDFMAHGHGFRWVSDYHWRKMGRFLREHGRARDLEAASPTVHDDALLIWGLVRNGRLELRPVLRVSGENACPPVTGTLRWQGLGADGQIMVDVPFGMIRSSDSAEGPCEGYFLFTIPGAKVRNLPLDRCRVVLAASQETKESYDLLGTAAGRRLRPGPGQPCKDPACIRTGPGWVTVDWDSDHHAMVTVKDIATRSVLAMGWQAPLELETGADQLLLCFPHGLETLEQAVTIADEAKASTDPVSGMDL